MMVPMYYASAAFSFPLMLIRIFCFSTDIESDFSGSLC